MSGSLMTQVTRTILQYAMTVKIRESNSAERTQFFSRKIPSHSLISAKDKTNGRIAHTRTKSWGQSRRTSLKFRARVYLAISFISEWNFKIFAAVSVSDIATQCFRGRCKICYIITMDNTPCNPFSECKTIWRSNKCQVTKRFKVAIKLHLIHRGP